MNRDLDEWYVAGVNLAIASFDRGEAIPHKQVEEWVESWGGDNEKPVPKIPKQ